MKRRRALNITLVAALGTQLLIAALSGQTAAKAAASDTLQQQQQQQQVAVARANYYGTLIGKLNKRDHNVSGDVYAVDEQTLFIRGFNYDGRAPDAYFWSSVTSTQPNADGFIVPDEKGSTKPLERYTDKDVVLRLPEGKTLREIHWLSVWSRQTKTNSGEISIPRNLLVPRPLEIQPFSSLAHGLRSGPITIVDAQTFLVPDFHYDGLGPAAYFWLTRGSQGLSATGLRLKDENGSGAPLRRYAGETVVITLPEEMTVYDFDFFGVWCKEYSVNFGQTRIPQNARVPPSPKMLGIKPENKLNCEILYDDLGYEIRWVLDGDDIVMQLVGKIEPGEYMAFGLGKDDSKSDMQNADAVVTWVDRASGQVHAVDYFLGAKQQCVNDPQGSCPDVKLQGGGDSLTLLHGAIVNGYSMVTFKRPQLGIDELYDQHIYSDGQQSVLWAIGMLNSKKEIGYHRLKARQNMFIDFARNPQWNCPIPDLNASMHNNLPLVSASQVDATVVSGASSSLVEQQVQPAVANSAASRQQVQTSAPIGATADSAAPLRPSLILRDNKQQPAIHAHQLELTRTGPQPGDTATGAVSPAATTHISTANTNHSSSAAASPDHWFIPSIVCPPERTFYAQIGPTGGRRGYEGVTGRTSWGVSWYVNGLLVPELVVERGQSYRFVVEGGNDKTSTTRRHPFYLTDSSEGGFDFKTDEERMKERIFAGVALRGDGQFVPTAEGRLCEWKQTNNTLPNPDLYPTFSAYQRSLKLDCLPGQASILKFAPDANTPDLIYYQCYTHRFMGWRIRVVSSCSAYLAALQRQSAGNNIKREAKAVVHRRDSEGSTWTPRSTYNRRSLSGSRTGISMSGGGDSMSGQDSMKAEASEPRISVESHPSMMGFLNNNEFGDDSPGSFSTEMTLLPSDALILNNSQLHQRQPLNLTSFDEILKLSAADLEFMENQPDTPLDAYLTSGFAGPGAPLPLHNFSTEHRPEANKTSTSAQTTKSPKTLHSYMRRLASIYYPVQQQLANMLQSGGGSTTASPQGSASNTIVQLQTAPSEQTPSGGGSSSGSSSSSFSLSSLVPKSKIDLSKSTITKKLNKLRFKTGRKYEPVKPSQPPTPTNEFNYDIFNNQLAQLEKQQKQFHALEMAAWPTSSSNGNSGAQQQQAASDSFNYLPIMADDQQSLDSMSFQTQPGLFLSNMPSSPNTQQPSPFAAMTTNNQQIPLRQHQQQHLVPNSNSKQQQQQQQQQPLKSNTYIQQQHRYPLQPPPLRYSEIPLGPPNQLGQQPYVSDYLSMVFNKTTDYPSPGQQVTTGYNINQQFPIWSNQQPSETQPPRQIVSQLQQPQPQPQQLQQPQQQQHQQQYPQQAIYITRLPQQQSSFPFHPKSQQQQQLAQQTIQHLTQSRPQHSTQISFQQDVRPLWPSQQVAGSGAQSARYPNIQPYSPNNRQPLGDSLARPSVTTYRDQPAEQYVQSNQMSTMPSTSLSIHESQDGTTMGLAPSSTPGHSADIESLSGSGSGSYFDFRQQPALKSTTESVRGTQATGDLDHMMAIERFSKQSSERWPSSLVHPITGEQVQLGDKNIVTTSSGEELLEMAPQQQQQHHQQQQHQTMSSGTTQQTPITTGSTTLGGLPRRFSALLIDNHIVASSEPTPVQSNELLDSDHTTLVHQTSDLKRINVSEPQQSPSTMLATIDNNDKVQRIGTFANVTQSSRQQTTTESIPSVLVKPSSYELNRDASTTSTVASTTSTSTLGPLIPSFGPPSGSNFKTEDGEIVLKSTLVEPTTSTLIQTPSMGPNPAQPNHYFNRPSFDSSPFTPIEIANPVYYANQQQVAASNLLTSRLRPPSLIESMLSQHQSALRPEPPVQVASYLAQHLISHNPAFITSERAVASNSPVTMTLNLGSSTGKYLQQQHQQRHQLQQQTQNQPLQHLPQSSNPNKTTNELIILKPTVLAKQTPQTYLLKPEYLTNQVKLIKDNSLDANQELYYSNDISQASRRLAGHQFERLSSLSSPPSTSIALDPMQTANNIAVSSYVRHSNSSKSNPYEPTTDGSPQSRPPNSAHFDRTNHYGDLFTGTVPKGNITTLSINADTTSGGSNNNNNHHENSKLAQHRQSFTLTKPIPLNFESDSSSSADGVRLSPGGDSINTLHRDNNTDNAILSHVMSLISSNAIPTPPLIPVASYSSADYFLPTSDRTYRSIRG